MAFVPFRKSNFLTSIWSSLLSSPRFCKFSSSKASKSIEPDRGHSVSNRLHLSPLFSDDKHDLSNCKIELVDDETWHISSALADAWRGSNNEDRTFKMGSGFNQQSSVNSLASRAADLVNMDVDFDAIEDMRIHGNLFYKLDKDSKEYEEYKFDFHGRKSSKAGRDRKQCREIEKEVLNEKRGKNIEAVTSKKDQPEAIKKRIESNSRMKLLLGNDGNKNSIGDFCIGKKQRTQTFNQLTAPYHEPFCLDIHVTRGSVRASIIHRATSKVVAVSHSISKDMKFDVGSCKNRSACAAVGEALAQRALADDIHNAVYTPRRGERLEGKLQIVFKSIINGGVNVKVRLKQKKLRSKARGPMPHARD